MTTLKNRNRVLKHALPQGKGTRRTTASSSQLVESRASRYQRHLAESAIIQERRAIQAVLGKRIRETRKKEGLSQHALARKCGMSGTVLAQIERGNKKLDVQQLLPIAKGLKTTVSDLFEGVA